jgi:hypothetical protein
MAVEIIDELEKSVVAECSALHKIRSTGGFRSVAITLLVLLAVTTAGLISIPWQQSISGVGRVTVYSPMDRPQAVEAPITAGLFAKGNR